MRNFRTASSVFMIIAILGLPACFVVRDGGRGGHGDPGDHGGRGDRGESGGQEDRGGRGDHREYQNQR